MTGRVAVLLLLLPAATSCSPVADDACFRECAAATARSDPATTWLERAAAWRRAGWTPAVGYAEARAALALQPGRAAIQDEAAEAVLALRLYLAGSLDVLAPRVPAREQPVGVEVRVGGALAERIEVRVGDDPLHPADLPTRSVALRLDEGAHVVTLHVCCTLPGLEGVVADVDVPVVVDRTAPPLLLADAPSLPDGALLVRHDDPGGLRGRTEPGAGVSAWDGRGANESCAVGERGAFAVSGPLLGGDVVVVEAVDPAGNATRRRVPLACDRRAPSIRRADVEQRADGWTLHVAATDDVGLLSVEAHDGRGATGRPLVRAVDGTFTLDGKGPPPTAVWATDRVGRETKLRLVPPATYEQEEPELPVGETVRPAPEERHDDRPGAEASREHDRWEEALAQAVTIRLDRTEALTFSRSRRTAWMRIRVPEAGTYAFEALARRAGVSLSLRVRVREEARPDNVLAERGGIRGRTFRGDPQAVALLAPGTYLVEVECRSGRGTAAFLVKRTSVRWRRR